MSDQPTTTPATRPEPKTVKDFLALPAYRGRFEEIMGKRGAQFMASISNYVSQTYGMSECEPRSVIASAFIAATLDLPIDRNLGFAWIVPYKKKGVKLAQFQMGYRGFVQLALRTSQYAAMNARAINAEAFGGYDKAVGEPIILWDKIDRSKPVVGYAVAWKLINGFVKTAYWTKEHVQAHAERYSQSFRSGNDSPWKTHFDDMALKTVLANELKRWGILSVDFQKAFAHDHGTQDDIDSPVKFDDGTGLFDVAATETMESALAGTPESNAAKSEGNASNAKSTTEGTAYTEAQLKGAMAELENLALNLSLTEARLIEQARAANLSVPKDAKKLSALPFATITALVVWAKAFAAGNA